MRDALFQSMASMRPTWSHVRGGMELESSKKGQQKIPNAAKSSWESDYNFQVRKLFFLRSNKLFLLFPLS